MPYTKPILSFTNLNVICPKIHTLSHTTKCYATHSPISSPFIFLIERKPHSFVLLCKHNWLYNIYVNFKLIISSRIDPIKYLYSEHDFTYWFPAVDVEVEVEVIRCKSEHACSVKSHLLPYALVPICLSRMDTYS